VSFQQYPGYIPPPIEHNPAWPAYQSTPYGFPSPVPRRHSPIPAYVTAMLFFGCGLLSLLCAIVSWDGGGNPYVLAAVIGLVYTARVTGNIDFGISLTMSVACTTLTFAAILLARLDLARWFLAGLGVLVATYYAAAVVALTVRGGFQMVGLPVFMMCLWSAAAVMAVLPFTARAMRRGSRRR
jgi:hypothetical protein